MFVLEALVLTFMTTPLVTWQYPQHLRTRIATSGANFVNVMDDEARPASRARSRSGEYRIRYAVVLEKLEHLPGMMALTQPFIPPLLRDAVYENHRVAVSINLSRFQSRRYV